MESHPTPSTDTPSPSVRPPVLGVAVAPIALGFFSMLVFWWFPFTIMLSTAGLVIGATCCLFGIRGGLRGENYALLGTAICATSLTLVLTLYKGLRFVMWDF